MKTLPVLATVWILFVILASCRSLAKEHTSAPMNSSQEPSLVFFTSEPGKFNVWLPSSTDVQEFTIQKTLFQIILECPTIFYRLNSAGTTVQYCDLLPQSIASLSSDEILNQTRDAMMSDLHARIDAQQEELAQDIYPSLVLSGQVDMRGMGYDGTFKARGILVNSRIYLIIMSVYRENWCNCLDQVDQVVDSLNIDPSLSIPFEPTP